MVIESVESIVQNAIYVKRGIFIGDEGIAVEQG